MRALVILLAICIPVYFILAKMWINNHQLKKQNRSLTNELSKTINKSDMSNFSQIYLLHELNGNLEKLPKSIKSKYEHIYLSLVFLDKRIDQFNSEVKLEFTRFKDTIFVESLNLTVQQFLNDMSLSRKEDSDVVILVHKNVDTLTRVVDSFMSTLAENNLNSLKVQDKYIDQKYSNKDFE